MHSEQASRTALGAAGHRAAHQILEHGAIFSDPLAARILGAYAGTAIQDARNDPSRCRLRLFIAVRTRFAEDALASALARGVRQIVVLGAGLDTYAYRATPKEGVRIFEVDHPATQAWKRECLAAEGIAIPNALTYAPVDFERESLHSGLAAVKFDPTQRTFFTWLGVVPYLSEQAIFATLKFIAALPGGAHVVFDYANPHIAGEHDDRAAERAALAARVAAIGESFKSYFSTDELHQKLFSLGFSDVEDLGPAEISARYFSTQLSVPNNNGGHVLHASTAYEK
jgi:methyltransferase (TIGR00027 family)